MSKQKFIYRYNLGYRTIEDIKNPPLNQNLLNGGKDYYFQNKYWKLSELSKYCGLSVSCLNFRINKMKWTVEKAISTPSKY